MKRVLPLVMFVVGTALLVLFLIMGLTRPSAEGVPPFTSAEVSFSVAFAMFLPMGAFVATRRPDNPIGWIACAIGLTEIVSGASYEYAIRALVVSPGSLPLGAEMAWLSSWTWAPGFALVAFLCLLFPTGSFLSPRWRWFGWLAASTTSVVLVGLLSLWPERGRHLLFSEDPSTPLVPNEVLQVAVSLLFASILVSFASILVRFRRSRGVERMQLKWMAFVASIAAVLLVTSEVMSALGVSESWDVVVENLLNISAAGVPIATAIAVLRYRLYDIDVIINRALVYGALTASLVGTYIGLVFGLQALLAPVTAESDLAVAASTLAVAALFRPVRARVQRFIDHRFYRRKFNAQRTLEDFSSHLRDEVELSALSSRLTGVVAETMQPAHVSIWLRGTEATP